MVVDVAPDGRWLALLGETFYGVAVRRPGQAKDLDIGWLDSSWDVSTAPDGESVLFSNGNGGSNYTVVSRRLDGSPISTLGDGNARGFSPDGAWAAGQISTPPEIVLYPTGAGTPRHLERGPIEKYEVTEWFPDGKSLLITGSEPSRPPRSWRQSIAGGPPVPVTPEGIIGRLAPRGDAVLARDADAAWRLFPLDGGAPRAVAGIDRGEEAVTWSPGGDAVFVRRIGEAPMRLVRVDLATGARTPGPVIGPADEVGLVRVRMSDPAIAPDRTFSYDYLRRLSKLFLVSGRQ
jgi:hypothetical protein